MSSFRPLPSHLSTVIFELNKLNGLHFINFKVVLGLFNIVDEFILLMLILAVETLGFER